MSRKIVLITGATKNSGLATAQRFASEGYDVCITSRREADAVKTALSIAGNYGVNAKGYGMDLESVEDIRKVFSNVSKTFGRLDVFVGNSANLGLGATVLDMTPEHFDGVMNVNVRGNFFCCQEAARIMAQKGGGSIVLIGSIHYRAAVTGRASYAISKGAVASMVHNLAYELAQHNIRVNQVVPGAIRTDRWDHITPQEEARRRANWPLGVESTGEDIANAVYFLASEQARTITGIDLVIDSGTLSCLIGYHKT